MRTIRDFFGGGDLLHLALVLSLLRVDIQEIGLLRNNRQNRIENDYQIRQRINPISQKVIDDLSELGRYGNVRTDPLEIAAYVLNTETNLFSNNFRNGQNDNNLLFDQGDDNIINPILDVITGEDLDSGVSDVGQMSDCETDGSRSPDNLNTNTNFAVDFGDLDVLSPTSSFGIGEDEIAERSDSYAPMFPDDFDFDQVSSYNKVSEPSFDGFDWREVESVASIQQQDEQAKRFRLESEMSVSEDHVGSLDGGAAFHAVADSSAEPAFDWGEIEAEAAMQEGDEDAQPKTLDFDPDEEDVENQLIEIDNRLIHLDGSIENLTDGVRHLGEQLATAQTDDTVDALLDDEDESFLFASLASESEDEMALAVGAVAMADTSFNPFDDWQMDVETNLDDILNGVTSAPVAVAAAASLDVLIKEEIVEENPLSPTTEKMKPVTIKEEKVEEDDEEAQAQMIYFDPDFVKTEHDDGSGSDYSSSSSSYSYGRGHAGMGHLANHSYAASADLMFSAKSSHSFSYDFEYDGASAMASGSPMSFCSDSSRARESRDERKARQLGIPFSLSDIIDSPMEEFNTLLTSTKLTEEQIAMCRDIRRRGKNKVAAQNCRRRKLDLISSLEVEVNRARQHKQQLLAEREELYRLRHEWSEKLRQLEEAVLRGLNKDSEQFSLQLSQDGENIRVAQRHSSRLTKPARA